MYFKVLYLFIIELVKLINRDDYVIATAMFYLHKFFKIHSLLYFSTTPSQSPLLIAASSVFLAAKVNYSPVSLHNLIKAYFLLEKKRNPALLSRTELT